MTDEKNEAEPSGASGGSLANRRRAMSKYDEWLAAKGIARGRGTAMDEILWLREERNRLRLTEAEREAIRYLTAGESPFSDEESRLLVLRGLLERLGGAR
jgi:hypothetical protein